MSNASTTNSSERRQRHFVDQDVQGALVRQAIWYWLLATAVFAFVILIFRIFPAWMSGKGPIGTQIWFHVLPFLVASAVLFPLLVHRAIKFSNRFVGPMQRFRHSLKQLARGEAAEPVELRKNDFWKDVADDINAVSARIEQSSRPRASTAGTSASQSGRDTQPIPEHRQQLTPTGADH
jgi:hypothetical protein